MRPEDLEVTDAQQLSVRIDQQLGGANRLDAEQLPAVLERDAFDGELARRSTGGVGRRAPNQLCVKAPTVQGAFDAGAFQVSAQRIEHDAFRDQLEVDRALGHERACRTGDRERLHQARRSRRDVNRDCGRRLTALVNELPHLDRIDDQREACCGSDAPVDELDGDLADVDPTESPREGVAAAVQEQRQPSGRLGRRLDDRSLGLCQRGQLRQCVGPGGSGHVDADEPQRTFGLEPSASANAAHLQRGQAGTFGAERFERNGQAIERQLFLSVGGDVYVAQFEARLELFALLTDDRDAGAGGQAPLDRLGDGDEIQRRQRALDDVRIECAGSRLQLHVDRVCVPRQLARQLRRLEQVAAQDRRRQSGGAFGVAQARQAHVRFQRQVQRRLDRSIDEVQVRVLQAEGFDDERRRQVEGLALFVGRWIFLDGITAAQQLGQVTVEQARQVPRAVVLANDPRVQAVDLGAPHVQLAREERAHPQVEHAVLDLDVGLLGRELVHVTESQPAQLAVSAEERQVQLVPIRDQAVVLDRRIHDRTQEQAESRARNQEERSADRDDADPADAPQVAQRRTERREDAFRRRVAHCLSPAFSAAASAAFSSAFSTARRSARGARGSNSGGADSRSASQS